MQALREIVKVKNHEIRISLPEYFNNNEELEVIVLPKEEINTNKKENKEVDDIMSMIPKFKTGKILMPLTRENIYGDYGR